MIGSVKACMAAAYVSVMVAQITRKLAERAPLVAASVCRGCLPVVLMGAFWSRLVNSPSSWNNLEVQLAVVEGHWLLFVVQSPTFFHWMIYFNVKIEVSV